MFGSRDERPQSPLSAVNLTEQTTECHWRLWSREITDSSLASRRLTWCQLLYNAQTHVTIYKASALMGKGPEFPLKQEEKSVTSRKILEEEMKGHYQQKCEVRKRKKTWRTLIQLPRHLDAQPHTIFYFFYPLNSQNYSLDKSLEECCIWPWHMKLIKK